MIEVKITGNSIPELADKLTAMGRALQVQVSYEADNAAREALQAARDATPEAEKPAKVRARKKAEPEAAPVTVVEDETEEQVDTETGEVTAAIPSEDEVTRGVLAAVERVGRDKVVAILTQFGVARASQVAPEQRVELLQMVTNA